MAMRPVATLTVNLGLFGFPVKAYTATETASGGISFRQVHAACKHALNQERVCRHCEASEDPLKRAAARNVPMPDVLKGYEEPDGSFLTFTDDEYKALKPSRGDTVPITGYMPLTELDPSYLDEHVYYLGPDKGKSKKADPKQFATFATFRDALRNRFAIGSVVLYGREHVVAIRAVGKLLAMHFVRTHTEVRQVNDVPDHDAVPESAPAEYVAMMAQVMEKQAISFAEVAIEKDAMVAAVEVALDAKRTGQQAEAVEPDAPVQTNVIDLKAALAASLARMAA